MLEDIKQTFSKTIRESINETFLPMKEKIDALESRFSAHWNAIENSRIFCDKRMVEVNTETLKTRKNIRENICCLSNELKNSFSEIDAKEIVIDQFVGQLIPLLSIYNLVLFNNINNFILYTFSVFFLFRLFDIFKPYPINIIDKKIKNGFGVMLDDVLAGIYSVIVFFLIFIVLNYV